MIGLRLGIQKFLTMKKKIFVGTWILLTGTWNDSGEWIDSETWND